MSVPFEVASELAAALRRMPCTCRTPHLSWPTMKEDAEPYTCERCKALAKYGAWLKDRTTAAQAETA